MFKKAPMLHGIWMSPKRVVNIVCGSVEIERWRGISKDLRNQTLLAAKKIGLEFGAADVLFHKGKWYFLELNSAPSVDHRVVREFYQAAMMVLIAKKFPEPVVKIDAEKKKENVVVEREITNIITPVISPTNEVVERNVIEQMSV
jgi:hypothetical protein